MSFMVFNHVLYTHVSGCMPNVSNHSMSLRQNRSLRNTSTLCRMSYAVRYAACHMSNAASHVWLCSSTCRHDSPSVLACCLTRVLLYAVRHVPHTQHVIDMQESVNAALPRQFARNRRQSVLQCTTSPNSTEHEFESAVTEESAETSAAVTENLLRSLPSHAGGISKPIMSRTSIANATSSCTATPPFLRGKYFVGAIPVGSTGSVATRCDVSTRCAVLQHICILLHCCNCCNPA